MLVRKCCRHSVLHYLTKEDLLWGLLMIVGVIQGLCSAFTPSCPERFICDCRLIGQDDHMSLDINCRHKNLTQLPDFSVFIGLPVQSIELSWNHITVLPGKAFSGLTFTQGRYTPAKIVMNANPLTLILDDAFLDLTADSLHLFIQYSHLVAYPFNAIRTLKNLTALQFWYSQVVDLQDGAFAGNRVLYTLDLTGNQISLLRASMFRGLEDVVESLYLRAMGLTAFPTDAIAQLRRLRYLILDENKIHILYGDIFFGSLARPRALSVSLQKNGMEFIAPDAFRTDADITVSDLDLTSNNISDFSFLSAPCALAFTMQNRILAYDNPIDCDCTLYSVLRTGYYTFDGRCSQPSNMSSIYVQAQYGAISKTFNVIANQTCQMITVWDLSCTVTSAYALSIQCNIALLLSSVLYINLIYMNKLVS